VAFSLDNTGFRALSTQAPLFQQDRLSTLSWDLIDELEVRMHKYDGVTSAFLLLRSGLIV